MIVYETDREKEERAAWDRYAAAASVRLPFGADQTAHMAAIVATMLLEERRKVFPTSDEVKESVVCTCCERTRTTREDRLCIYCSGLHTGRNSGLEEAAKKLESLLMHPDTVTCIRLLKKDLG